MRPMPMPFTSLTPDTHPDLTAHTAAGNQFQPAVGVKIGKR